MALFDTPILFRTPEQAIAESGKGAGAAAEMLFRGIQAGKQRKHEKEMTEKKATQAASAQEAHLEKVRGDMKLVSDWAGDLRKSSYDENGSPIPYSKRVLPDPPFDQMTTADGLKAAQSMQNRMIGGVANVEKDDYLTKFDTGMIEAIRDGKIEPKAALDFWSAFEAGGNQITPELRQRFLTLPKSATSGYAKQAQLAASYKNYADMMRGPNPERAAIYDRMHGMMQGNQTQRNTVIRGANALAVQAGVNPEYVFTTDPETGQFQIDPVRMNEVSAIISDRSEQAENAKVFGRLSHIDQASQRAEYQDLHTRQVADGLTEAQMRSSIERIRSKYAKRVLGQPVLGPQPAPRDFTPASRRPPMSISPQDAAALGLAVTNELSSPVTRPEAEPEQEPSDFPRRSFDPAEAKDLSGQTPSIEPGSVTQPPAAAPVQIGEPMIKTRKFVFNVNTGAVEPTDQVGLEPAAEVLRVYGPKPPKISAQEDEGPVTKPPKISAQEDEGPTTGKRKKAKKRVINIEKGGE